MLARLRTFALVGIEAVPVDVEVDIAAAQVPRTVLVGLPELTVRESVHRIERALDNQGYVLPTGRTVVNLAPAELRKDASAFDLPIAVGILIASGQVRAAAETAGETALVGELALDGSVRPVAGVLSMALQARQCGCRRLIVPRGNAREAAVVGELEVYGVAALPEAVAIFAGTDAIEPVPLSAAELSSETARYDVDFADVRGQEFAKRALVIAAAGGHNLLMLGSPGGGKTMLARRLPTILPPLTMEESLETTRIYSACGLLPPGEGLMRLRPFRAPHHTISDAGMVGGGSHPQPGEISLAHHGVLFLDELPEFNRRSLEALRQPLEEGRVTISRAAHAATFPADFILVAAMNPCPCGYLGDPKRRCQCSPVAVEKYRGRISGPLLDRIDLHIEVPAVPYDDLHRPGDGASSAVLRQQVEAARQLQRQRLGPGLLNGRMGPRHIRQHCVLDATGRSLLQNAMESLGLSARAHDRILRVARTIADLEGVPHIRAEHVAEAITYRTLDRRLWPT